MLSEAASPACYIAPLLDIVLYDIIASVSEYQIQQKKAVAE